MTEEKIYKVTAYAKGYDEGFSEWLGTKKSSIRIC